MRWPWTRPEPTNTAVIERLEAVERKLKALQTDWDTTYEQFQRLNAKLAQRWRRLAAAEQAAGDAPGPEGEPPAPGEHPGVHPHGITNPLALELLRGVR